MIGKELRSERTCNQSAFIDTSEYVVPGPFPEMTTEEHSPCTLININGTLTSHAFQAAKLSSNHTETKKAPVPSSGVLFRWIAVSCFEGSSRERLSRRQWWVAVVSHLIASLHLISLWPDGTSSPHSNYNLTKPDTADRGSIRRVGFLFWAAMIGSNAGESASTPDFDPASAQSTDSTPLTSYPSKTLLHGIRRVMNSSLHIHKRVAMFCFDRVPQTSCLCHTQSIV